MPEWITRFHAAVDSVKEPVERANASRLNCTSGCADCCVDGLTVFAVEAAEIVEHHAQVLAEAPHPPGGCAFLDGERRCRIYEHRPYVCRTQGLPLRWLEEDESTDEVFEARDICPLNDAVPLEELTAEECWSIGPFEERLAREQNDGRRVSLRSLFAGPADVGPADIGPADRRRLPVLKG